MHKYSTGIAEGQDEYKWNRRPASPTISGTGQMAHPQSDRSATTFIQLWQWGTKSFRKTMVERRPREYSWLKIINGLITARSWVLLLLDLLCSVANYTGLFKLMNNIAITKTL